jgi:hypothetical protein
LKINDLSNTKKNLNFIIETNKTRQNLSKTEQIKRRILPQITNQIEVFLDGYIHN